MEYFLIICHKSTKTWLRRDSNLGLLGDRAIYAALDYSKSYYPGLLTWRVCCHYTRVAGSNPIWAETFILFQLKYASSNKYKTPVNVGHPPASCLLPPGSRPNYCVLWNHFLSLRPYPRCKGNLQNVIRDREKISFSTRRSPQSIPSRRGYGLGACAFDCSINHLLNGVNSQEFIYFCRKLTVNHRRQVQTVQILFLISKISLLSCRKWKTPFGKTEGEFLLFSPLDSHLLEQHC